jgi:UDP-hydrolysing UDP-N-acetyl-D-glucosamine 2-epimerase
MRVLVVSSSRADFGLLTPVIRELQEDEYFEVVVCEIGSHISKHSESFQQLQAAGMSKLDLSIDTLLQDSPDSKASFVATIIVQLTSYFSSKPIDAILILGDRYETLAIAYAAALSNIPIIHFAGGDLTFGSIDDNYRHAITKLSKVHFVTNTNSQSCVLQLGEEAEFVRVSGSPGLDSMNQIDFVAKENLEALLGLKFQEQIILVTFHPDSIRPTQIKEQVNEVIQALEQFLPSCTIIITGANHDSGYTIINEMFSAFSARYPNLIRFIENLGTRNYFSLMKIATVMVGNSSSGYYEAPSFGLPVIDLGDRQVGRMPHELLSNVSIESSEIVLKMRLLMSQKRRNIANPYGDGKCAEKVKDFLKLLTIEDLKAPKRFTKTSIKELD